MAPAVRTYLLETQGKIKQVAFFLTKGGSPGDKPFNDMTVVSGREPIALFEIKESELRQGELAEKLKSFIETLKRA